MAHAWGSLLGAVRTGRPAYHEVFGRPFWSDLAAHPGVAASFDELMGVAGHGTASAQSFFDPLPAGSDLYLLKNVLADWPDREAAAILTRCAEAADPAGRVVVLGGVSPDDDGEAAPELLMLVLVGGRDRTLTEFAELARGAGLRISAAGRLPSGRFVVECRPAAAPSSPASAASIP